MKERNVTFNAFTLVHTDEVIRSWGARMDYLEKLGFITVEREHTDAKNLPDAIARWTKKVDTGEMGIPVDGLVITYDDTDYAATGSVTGSSRHARGPCLQMGGRLRRHGARPHRMVVRGLDHHAGRGL